ncbi:AAA family ATPase [Candidatus Uhrbacteria bacterium]|nr:AAA family ATPase [Candidatus Uhrbacteria bacterium]
MYPEEDEVKIIRLQVKDFEGLEALDVLPGGGVNVLRGRNGTGKTSVLDAIRVALTNRGERSLLVRKGAEDGLILFELEGGIRGEREINRSGRVAGPLTLTNGENAVSRAQTFLNRLGGGFNYNPLDFIGMTDAEQTKVLLDLIAIDVSRDELLALSDGEELDGVDYDQHPIIVLGEIETALMELRRDTGRRARDLEGMAEDLFSKVPPDFDREHVESFDLEAASLELSSIEAHEQRIKTAEASIQDFEVGIQRVEGQIEALLEQKRSLVEQKQQAEARVGQLAAQDVGNAGEIRERIRTYTQDRKHLHNLEMSESTSRQAQDCRQEYKGLTQRIDDVRRKPAEILSSSELPVDGLGVDEGKLTINGLPISELSTGEQLHVATQIAVATLGDLRVVLVDGVERLDPGHKEVLLRELSEAGVQAFVTEVSDEALTIITDFETETFDDVPF